MRFLCLSLFILLSVFCSKGQEQSASFHKDTLDFKCKHNPRFWKQMIAPSVFFGLSALSWQERENVRAIRNRYIPDFAYRLDDYMQFAPAATALALNVAGIKGRNRPARAAISYGSSALIMAGIVNAIKYSSRIMRPDETTKNSFPSGHTATAFMNASFLDKEYGLINPLYSTLGYAMSTYTGISRSLNNRHWISDILAGAGIGILSTELGYLIVDKVYQNKGDFFADFDARVEVDKPSFLTIKLGQAFYADIQSFDNLGLEGALEGAYFFNRKWGVGAEIGFMHIPFEEESINLSDWDELSENILDPCLSIQSLGLKSFMAGVYYSKFLGSKFILQGKLSVGLATGVGGDINIRGQQNIRETLQTIEIPLMQYSINKTGIAGAGISATAMVAPTIGLSLYVDYKYTNPTVNIFYSTASGLDTNSGYLPIHALSCGIRFVSFF